jgi:hypothetical protein
MISVVSRGHNMICTEVDDVVVILDIESGKFFQLNRTASQVWNLLEQPIPMPDLCARLEQDFAVNSQTCAEDVSAFITELAGSGLINVADSQA